MEPKINRYFFFFFSQLRFRSLMEKALNRCSDLSRNSGSDSGSDSDPDSQLDSDLELESELDLGLELEGGSRAEKKLVQCLVRFCQQVPSGRFRNVPIEEVPSPECQAAFSELVRNREEEKSVWAQAFQTVFGDSEDQNFTVPVCTSSKLAYAVDFVLLCVSRTNLNFQDLGPTFCLELADLFRQRFPLSQKGEIAFAASQTKVRGALLFRVLIETGRHDFLTERGGRKATWKWTNLSKNLASFFEEDEKVLQDTLHFLVGQGAVGCELLDPSLPAFGLYMEKDSYSMDKDAGVCEYAIDVGSDVGCTDVKTAEQLFFCLELKTAAVPRLHPVDSENKYRRVFHYRKPSFFSMEMSKKRKAQDRDRKAIRLSFHQNQKKLKKATAK